MYVQVLLHTNLKSLRNTYVRIPYVCLSVGDSAIDECRSCFDTMLHGGSADGQNNPSILPHPLLALGVTSYLYHTSSFTRLL